MSLKIGEEVTVVSLGEKTHHVNTNRYQNLKKGKRLRIGIQNNVWSCVSSITRRRVKLTIATNYVGTFIGVYV